MASEAKPPLLTVQDLRVEFRTRRGAAMVLNGVDFELHGGETLCVVGESGCTRPPSATASPRPIWSRGTGPSRAPRVCPSACSA